MRTRQQYQDDALRRVQAFLDAHPNELGTLKDSEGRKQLDDVVVQVAALANEQGTADRAMAGQASRQRALIVELKQQHMQPIATFARAKLRGAPDFAALTKSPSGLQAKPLVSAARTMATAAAAQAAVLTQGGFPADTIAQLGAAADAVNTAIMDRANTKVRRVAATKGIREQLTRGREALHMLSAVVTKHVNGDKTLLAGWRAARRVVAKPGVPRTPAVALVHATPPRPISTSTPPSTPAPPPSTSSPLPGPHAG